MWVPFHELPDDARVWVYQSTRSWSQAEAERIEVELMQWCSHWQAHGNALRSSFATCNNQFVVLAVDERHAGASGCSIDGSVRKMKEIETATGLSLFDRTVVAFLKGEKVITIKLNDLKEGFLSGELHSELITFNNAVASKHDFSHNWKIPVKNSWLAKYLPKTTLQV